MKKQAGFTLVEIAIVLVIIGLLLGGVLKGQELINSAKVKNFAQDFRNLPILVYGYQDKFKKIPGDDANAEANVAVAATHKGNGDGVISGAWDSTTPTDESVLFWEHVRKANLASGPTDFTDSTKAAASLPTNADGGRIGVQGLPPIASSGVAIKGSYFMCSGGINGKFAKQLDLTMDDGNPAGGSMMAVLTATGTAASLDTPAAPPAAVTSYDDGQSYIVCMGF